MGQEREHGPFFVRERCEEAERVEGGCWGKRWQILCGRAHVCCTEPSLAPLDLVLTRNLDVKCDVGPRLVTVLAVIADVVMVEDVVLCHGRRLSVNCSPPLWPLWQGHSFLEVTRDDHAALGG